MSIHIESWRNCLALIMCNPPQVNCFFRKCSECLDKTSLKELLQESFEEHCIDTITYKKWTATDRSSLETVVESTEDFIESFISKLGVLAHHSFIAEQQSNFLKNLQETILPNEFIVVLDFSENYSFVLQDEVQAHHWSTAQCTVHPFGIYYREPETQNLRNKNFIVLSDCLKHNTILVHVFQRHLVEYLKETFSTVTKIYYFSDGSAAQYKNKKNFLNVSMHHEDFGIPAEWHFFATAHGKSICDGLGGTLKRLATKTSLQRPYNEQITTVNELFNWAKSSLQNIDVAFVAEAEYTQEERNLATRFSNLKRIPGTQSKHAIIPISVGSVTAKEFSNSSDGTIHNLCPE